MPEFAATTGSARAAYVNSTRYPGFDPGTMFDRWLAARDRENRAIGWDEGVLACWRTKYESGFPDNPYRGDNE